MRNNIDDMTMMKASIKLTTKESKPQSKKVAERSMHEPTMNSGLPFSYEQ